MARFKFSLQKVLDIRKHREDQKAIEMQKIQMQLIKAQKKLQAINEHKIKALGQPTQPVVDLTMHRVHNDYLNQLSSQIMKQQQKIQSVMKQVDDKRKELAGAVQERKAVELLREKRLMDHKKEINRKAAIQENEVALRMATQTN